MGVLRAGTLSSSGRACKPTTDQACLWYSLQSGVQYLRVPYLPFIFELRNEFLENVHKHVLITIIV